MMERRGQEDLKWYLMNKYRTFFLDKLTLKDLEELQFYQRRLSDTRYGRDHEYLRKFVLKLLGYMPEEILKREIIGIETLVTLMKPEDLQNNAVQTGLKRLT
ncbi:MAG: hypothetical protein WCB46_10360 [Methanoregula sp.]